MGRRPRLAAVLATIALGAGGEGRAQPGAVQGRPAVRRAFAVRCRTVVPDAQCLQADDLVVVLGGDWDRVPLCYRDTCVTGQQLAEAVPLGPRRGR